MDRAIVVLVTVVLATAVRPLVDFVVPDLVRLRSSALGDSDRAGVVVRPTAANRVVRPRPAVAIAAV